MKLSIEREKFLPLLSHAKSLVEKRYTDTPLSFILLKTLHAQLQVLSTDREISLEQTTPAKINEQGFITANAHQLYSIVEKLPEGSQLTLRTSDNGNGLHLSWGRSFFILPSLQDPFPSIPQKVPDYQLEFLSSDLLKLLENVQFSVPREDVRYYLNGIYIHKENPQLLSAISTDGHRLAKMSLELHNLPDSLHGSIIPNKACLEIISLFKNTDDKEKISLYLDQRRLQIRANTFLLTTKLIDGKFPDYQKVIPQQNHAIATINVSTFKNAVDRMIVLLNQPTTSRAITISLENNTLTLEADSQDGARGKEELPIDYTAQPFSASFKPDYILQYLRQINSSDVQLAVSTEKPSTPIIMRPPNAEHALYIVAPMQS